MTKREEAEQAMRYGLTYATEEARVALLREAINEALEEAAVVTYSEMFDHPWWAYPYFRALTDKVTDRIRALKKEP